MKLMNIASLGLAAMVTTGLIAYATPAVNAANDVAFKRSEDTPDVVMTVDDEDDDDTGNDTNTGGGANSGTGNSNDGTNSVFTAVSRDNDHSRGDKTKDWTRDGGDRTRDHSANQTNDGSLNDTRR